ncbi:MAG: TonB-dependent receptor plug domain-containing protein [Pseudomonadota bacterium]
MKHKKLYVAISLAFTGGIHAQTSLPSVVVVSRPVIEDVVVDAFSSATAVITQDQLRDQNAVDIASALRRTPGVQVARYNPVGAFGGDQGGAIFIRGMGASRPGSEIKTYIDGVPVYGSLANHPLLDLLPINGMQSITVYKSPQPHINGNNFASINLETKRPTEDGVHGDARISTGAFATTVEQANLVGRQGNLDYTLAQGYATSIGHRPNANGTLSNFMGTVNLHLNESWSMGASFLYFNNKSNDPGDARVAPPAVVQQFNTVGNLVTTYVSHAHNSASGELRVYSNSGGGDWLNQPAPNGDWLIKSKLSGVRWKETVTPWKDGTVVAGIDHDRMDGSAQFNFVAPAPQSSLDAPTFAVTSPYVAVSQRVALNTEWALVPSAGIRFYKHSDFNAQSAPHAGLSLTSNAVTVFANVSRGVNYPGLDTTLFAALIPPLGESWKNLTAEEMEHAEIGVKFTPSASTRVDISLFQDKVKNRYIFGFPPDIPPPPQFINLGAYQMRGAELALRQTFTTNWSIFGGLTLLAPSIDNLPYAPQRAFTVGVNGKVGDVRIAFDAQYQSDVWALNRSRMAGATNTERVDAFTVANARVSYPIAAMGKKGEVFVAVENLFDRTYAYRPGYAMPGRWAQIGLSASF